MKMIQANVPDDLAAMAQEVATGLNQTMDQFVASAITKQITNIKRTKTIEERAKLGDANAFRAVLDRVPNVPPLPGDEI